ncbi:hypothetical protein BDK51DRAFT_52156 [Blyttiomyces helicus]|uniref:Uncharacterized protein n=1 Tax=Blyttiomyces helicus TaxID=388810 RepID=A0A4P9WNA1_9FUNG|nr:hypothetical protein BDK51DRAFT_52156 [Blyttiomyces helicus]|eukprot:RKO92236.1 hypothetical protein BDK51DRAFT_52156 [Blyttiomyces helicus]
MATSVSKELSNILGYSAEGATPGNAKYKDSDADVHPSLSGAGIDLSDTKAILEQDAKIAVQNAQIDSLNSMMQDLTVTLHSIFGAVSNPDEYKMLTAEQSYRFSSRGDVVAALLLSIIDNIKQRIEVREKQQFQSRSHTLFNCVATARSVAIKLFRIKIGAFAGGGYTDVISTLASSDRYPTCNIDSRVYQLTLTSPPVIEFSRAIGVLFVQLKLVPEIFDLPGDNVMYFIKPSLFYPHSNDFALAIDMYITARMSGITKSQSYQYMTLLPKLNARDLSFTVPEVKAAESIKAVLSEEYMYT